MFEKMNDDVKSWDETARLLYEKGQNEAAEEVAKKALQNALNEHDFATQATAFNTIGITYLNRTHYEKAIHYFLQAEQTLRMLDDKNQLLPCLVNIAIVLNTQKRYEEAIGYYQKALAIVGEDETMQKAQILNGLANVLHNSAQNNEALALFLKVKAISEKHHSAFGIAMGAKNASASLIELSRYNEAIQLSKLAIEVSKKNEFVELYIGAVQTLAEANMGNQKYEDAISILQEILPDTIKFNNDYINRHHYRLLYQCYKQLRSSEYALHYLELWEEIDKKLNNAERIKIVNQLHIQYESEKKELELKKAQIQQKETEIAALKSRMNPHFLFNALGNIQKMLYANQNAEAIHVIENFSSLTREILQQSQIEWITVRREINMLRAYIELAKNQLPKDFSYIISGEEACAYFEIPPLLLQPIVENAIQHGLRHKEGDKKLQILFELISEDELKVIIEDNGIGRTKASIINAQRFNHQSFALKSIEERIKLLKERKSMEVEYEVIDMVHSAEPLGTKTIFTFKYINE